MPKLLQIDSSLNMLSTGRITESIGRMAIELGWDCYIVHGPRAVNRPSCMHSIQACSKLQVYFHFIESFLFDRHGLASRRTTKKVINQIKAIKPDIIHLHCIHGYYLNYELLFEYLKTTQIQVVWTFHDCWSFTGHCAHFVSKGNSCEKWKTHCSNCPLLKSYPQAIFDRSYDNFSLKKVLFTSVDKLHIVTVSRWLEGLARSSFFSEFDIETIYNGVDITVFKPVEASGIKRKLSLEHNKILLAAATTWGEWKGYNDYITLSSLLPEGVVIVLVGLEGELAKNLPSNVIAVPRTNSTAELAEYYSMADIVLNLSYAETFGLTTAEAMACGTPCIVYNSTASPELIKKETGMVVEPGDYSGLVNAIDQILRKGKSCYSKNCREEAEYSFDKEKQFARYITLYEELLSKR